MAEQKPFSLRGSETRVNALGITQRATPLDTPWTGDLRVRFTDFQVNEIGEDGNVVRLNSIGVAGQQKRQKRGDFQDADETKNLNGGQKEEPKDNNVKDEPKDSEMKDQPVAEPKPQPLPFEISDEDRAILNNLAGAAFAQGLLDLINSNEADSQKTTEIGTEPLEDKTKRGEIHQQVRRIFDSKIDTNTASSGAILATLIRSKKGKKRGRGTRDRAWGDAAEERPTGEYLRFTMYKDNRDTMDAVGQMARMLRIKPQNIGYAGTKDRRASTVQRCSLRYGRPPALSAMNGKLWGIITGDYEFHAEGIHLGQLRGNEFTITLKNCALAGMASSTPVSERVDALRANVEPALQHLIEHGWINYFGHQRFGTHQIGTHEIGKMLLGGKFEEAVDALLSYDSEVAERAESGEPAPNPAKRDEYTRHHACMLFRTGKDLERAMQLMPKRFSGEVAIMRHLSRTPASGRDFMGAIKFITRGLRSMYLHAYQSYVWNHAASRRWELYGSKTVAGDLVVAETQAPAEAETDQDGGDVINPPLEDDDVDDSGAGGRARALTEEEARSGKWTIHDVVLPSPGHDVLYPTNELGAFYGTFMGAEENGALDPHSMRRMQREFSLPGTYRKLMNRFFGGEPSAEVRAYADNEEQMFATDLEKVRAEKRERRVSGRAEQRAGEGVEGETKTEAETVAGEEEVKMGDAAPVPDKVAVIVKFQLGRSAYATVTLRELMGDPPEIF